MKMKSLLCVFLLKACLIVPLFGQPAPGGVAAELERLFARMRTDLPSAKKMEINDSINSIIKIYSESDSVFKHKFTNLRYLGQIISPDSLLKIITWNIVLQNGTSKYFCYLVKRNTTVENGRVFFLTADYRENAIRTDTVYSSHDWYGALYYDARPFSFNGNTYYIILGIDYGNTFVTRKIIDVLDFTGDNNIIFGLECFIELKDPKHRVVFEYSPAAVMSLRFENDKMAVFDHLSPFSPELKNNRQFYGPDFSFDAFILKNGFWRLESDIDIKNK